MDNKNQLLNTIRQQLKLHSRSISWLCREIGWHRQKWYRFRDNGVIEINDVKRISILLNYNLFWDLYLDTEPKLKNSVTK